MCLDIYYATTRGLKSIDIWIVNEMYSIYNEMCRYSYVGYENNLWNLMRAKRVAKTLACELKKICKDCHFSQKILAKSSSYLFSSNIRILSPGPMLVIVRRGSRKFCRGGGSNLPKNFWQAKKKKNDKKEKGKREVLGGGGGSRVAFKVSLLL